jgi:SAM-dependent methyltransferase
MTRLKRKKEVTNPTEKTTQSDVRFGTPELVAKYRADRLVPGHDTVIEIGAGAGFQTAAFAKTAKKVIAVDVDAERLSRATFPDNVVAIAGDALDPKIIAKIKKEVIGTAVVFLDPERPASSTRRTIEEISPNPNAFLEAYKEITEDIAIELPPFLNESEIPKRVEREYLSVDGQLNRLTIYTGALAKSTISVVRLPDAERVEHTGHQPPMREDLDPKTARYILEPDAALAHAALEALVLPAHYRRIPLGRKTLFLASKAPTTKWFRSYKIVAQGQDDAIRRALLKRPPAAVILHGALEPKQQRELLASYKPLCHGEGRLHLFWGRTRYLTTRE